MTIIKRKIQGASVPTAYGNMRVYVEEDEKGQPVDIRANVGKEGTDHYADASAITRIASLAVRSGKASISEVYRQLIGIGGDNAIPHGKTMIKSIPDALGKALRELYPPEEKK